MTRIQTVTLLTVASLAGCAAQGAPSPQGHDQAEMRIDVEAVAQWRADGEWLVSPVLDAPEGATRVGVYLGMSEPAAMPRLQARALSQGMPVGEWTDVSETWSEVDHYVGIAELGTIGDGAELRIGAATAPLLSHLRWNAVIPGSSSAAT